MSTTTHGDFKLGSKEFWEISKKYRAMMKMNNMIHQKKRKSFVKINVRKNKW